MDPTRALILSQVVLSLALPVPMIALVVFTSRRSVMGPFANGPWTKAAATAGAAVVLTLNGCCWRSPSACRCRDWPISR